MLGFDGGLDQPYDLAASLDSEEQNSPSPVSMLLTTTISPSTSGNLTLEPDNSFYLTPEVKSVLIIVYCATTFASVFGNILAISVFATGKRCRTDIRPFLINLAVADLIMGIFCIPFTFTVVILGTWIFTRPMCPIVLFFQLFSVTMSVSTNMAIGIDRLIAVTNPLKSRITTSKTHYTIASIWLIAVAISCVQLFVAKVNVHGIGDNAKMECAETWSKQEHRMVYTWIILLLTCIVPLIMLIITYSIVGSVLWRRTAPGNADETRDQLAIRAKIKVVKMLVTIVFLFGSCWLPIHIFTMVLDYNPTLVKDHRRTLTILYIIIHWLAMANSFMNPIIYGFMNDNFRSDLKTSYQKCCRSCSESSERQPVLVWKRNLGANDNSREMQLTRFLLNLGDKMKGHSSMSTNSNTSNSNTTTTTDTTTTMHSSTSISSGKKARNIPESSGNCSTFNESTVPLQEIVLTEESSTTDASVTVSTIGNPMLTSTETLKDETDTLMKQNGVNYTRNGLPR